MIISYRCDIHYNTDTIFITQNLQEYRNININSLYNFDK